jgi:YVTN family beta-propeller protein
MSIPNELSSAAAAPLLCAGLTTFNALRNAPAKAGDLVAVLGIGGLGHLGVQYARHMGFEVVAIARGTGTAELAKKAGSGPIAVAVNPVTNKIYVANQSSNNVTVIDGFTNITNTVAAGSQPAAVAVNPVTNKIYVANPNSSDVTVIDGATNSPTTVGLGAGAFPTAVAVNSVTNKIYVPNAFNNPVTVIDGATNSTSTVGSPGGSFSVAVNPVTNKIYVPNNFSNNVTVIDEQQVQPIPISTSIAPLAGNVTASATPSFNFTASSAFTPFTPRLDKLLFQVDTWQGAWQAGTSLAGGAFSGTTPALQQGFHLLYAYATDGQEATSTNTGTQSSPLIGNITAYGFLAAFAQLKLSAATLSFSVNQPVGTTSSQDVTLTNSGNGPLNVSSVTATGEFSTTTNCVTASPLAPGATCTESVTFAPTTTGPLTGTLTFTDDSGGVAGSAQTVSLSGTGVDFTIAASPSSQTIPIAHTAPFTLTLAPVSGFTGTVSLGCSGGPATSTCSISPSSLTLNGTSSATAKVSISFSRNSDTKGTFVFTLTGTFCALGHQTQVSVTVKD